MPRGKAHTCPRIVVTHAAEPRFASRDEAWAVVGPIIARILAQAILADKKKEKSKRVNHKKKHSLSTEVTTPSAGDC